MNKAKRGVARRPRTGRYTGGWEQAGVAPREEPPIGSIDNAEADDLSESARLVDEGSARADRDLRILAIMV